MQNKYLLEFEYFRVRSEIQETKAQEFGARNLL